MEKKGKAMGIPSDAFVKDLLQYAAIDHTTEHAQRSIVEVYTQKEFGKVPDGTKEDIQRAFEKARVAQKGWEAKTVEERCAILMRFSQLLLENCANFINLIQVENGKAFKYAQEEVLDCYLTARYYAQRAPKILKTRGVPATLPLFAKAQVALPAEGVVGVIAPFNFPLILSIGDALAALVAGNAVVIKPSIVTPFCTLFAAKLLYEAGVPRDVLPIVPGQGSTIGKGIVELADHIMFTGSTATGKQIAVAGAERLVEVSAELGGKNPLIVTQDAKVKTAALGAVRAAFTGTGQVCVSIERMYVVDAIYDDFVQEISRLVKNLRIGPNYGVNNDVGSLTTKEQFETTQSHVEDARSKGAKVLAGGKARPDLGPFFYEPTLLEGVTEDMRVFKEETFGPVASIYRVKNIDEAIELANESEYGLNAAIWAGSRNKAFDIAHKLHVGTVNINEGYALTWTNKSGPMGGAKVSGLGRRHGIVGLTRFTQPRLVAGASILTFEKIPLLSSDMTIKVLPKILSIVDHLPRWHREKY